MSINKAEKQKIIEQYKVEEGDTGSPEVQVALLTNRITYLTGHFKIHKKDKHSRVGLIKMINRRRKLLAYLKSKNQDSYLKLIADLGLRK